MYAILESPIGFLLIRAENDCITGLYMINEEDRLKYKNSDIETNIMDQCIQELTEYFKGKRKIFDVKLHMEGTDFQKKVWDALLEIPYGSVATYKDIAVKIGNPKAVRAVGGANHNNPISIIVPCHRVIGVNQSLTGYGGGLDKKEWLLKHEGWEKR